MSNTSLTPIKIPKLNSADFGKSIMQAFENIDLNFQKLANLDVNKGAPGRSCVYVPIHLGAAFVYDAYDVNDTRYSDCYNAFYEWKKRFGNLETDHGDAWKNLIKEVDEAYKQYNTITGKSKQEYARLACILLWGNPCPFGFGSTPQPGSLTAVLHEHYKGIDGAAKIVYPDGNEVDMYGDWLYELYKYNPVGSTNNPDTNLSEIRRIIGEYYNFFSIHFGVVGIGKVVMALSPDPVYSSYHPVGSFEYWYVDPRYRCGIEPSGESVTGDISCVLRWVTDTYENGNNVTWDGHFEILEIFPTIRVGENGEYRWHINGMDTGIPVQGKPGQDGKSTQMLVVERIENVRGWHPTTAPNGEDFWSPKSGAQVFRMLNYSGVPSRVLNDYSSFTGKLESNFEFTTRKNAPAPLAETTIKAGFDRTTDYTGRVTQFVMTEEKPWLSVNADEQTKNIAEVGYLFRIFRIVGREKFYTYGDAEPNKGVMATDEYDRAGDPSCDVYYFGHEGASHISEEQSIQELIKELDGSLAIVLPGPAYKHDRTDTAFWFATLRAVKTDNPDVFELVAYCSPHAQQTTQLDEHSQAGMMQSFDAYTHKSTSDNRNKPRGLMLPIGSSLATSGNFTDTWAAHVIHSDTGGFIGYKGGSGDRRGYQDVISDDATDEAFTGGIGRLSNNLNKDVGVYNGQFTEVINKRILHVGSVNDYRALNYVEDAPQNYKTKDNKTIHTLNGAVPGRIATGDENGLIGNASFFGAVKTDMFGNNWFVGSELHVDEPVTITRYRDLKAKGRLLDVEGDVVIAPYTHKNFPDIKYRYRSGGLWVASTITNETIGDVSLTEDKASIFPRALINGEIQLSFESFIKSPEALMWNTPIRNNDDGHRDNVWKTELGRWNGNRAIEENIGDVLGGTAAVIDDRPLFSGVFNDTIGARMIVVRDGIAIYNPFEIGDSGSTVNVPFSVDALGNIQTYGREIRSNADDTAWYFHTRWSNQLSGLDNITCMIGGVKTPTTLPKRNNLNVSSTHEIRWGATTDPTYNTRYWRTSNAQTVEGDGIDDPAEIPYGYIHTFGFSDNNGNAVTAFPHISGSFGKAFGVIDYIPTILSEPVDIHWLWGSLLCSGINPRATQLVFDKNEYSARFGGVFKHGLIISEPARTNIGIENLQDSNTFDHDVFKSDDLAHTYDGRIMLADKQPNGSNETLGVTKMFDKKLSSPIGLWNMQGMVVEKAMIIGGDILGYNSASIRGQIRAKSFRRHVCSYDDPNHASPFALLFDSGMSSCPAPKHTKGEGCSSMDTGFTSNDVSPIVFDMGSPLGKNRLIRFGYAQRVRLVDGEIAVTVTDDEDKLDHNACLFGKIPEQYATTRTYSYCWDYGTTKNRAILATGDGYNADAAGGGIIYWNYRKTHDTKEKQTYSNPDDIPQWFIDAVKTSDCTIDGERKDYDPETDTGKHANYVEQGWMAMKYNAVTDSKTFNNKKHKKDSDVQRYPFEIGYVEAITSPYMVTVNVYILCLGKWEQMATPGNRCCRGIFGAGMGKAGGTNNRMWRNLPTKLRLPTGVPLPAHSVYAQMSASMSSCNKNKDGKWKTKSLNGDKPIIPGMTWRLGIDGMIWLNTSSMGMAMFNQDDGAYLAQTTFTYPINKNSRICDKILPLGAIGIDDNGEIPDLGEETPPNDPTTGEEQADVDAAGNWMWDSTIDPTIDTLNAWLKDPLRANLLEAIVSISGDDISDEDGSVIHNAEVGDVNIVSGPFGDVSVKKLADGTSQISLWVTSYSADGSSELTHRSINFKYDAAGNITELNSILLGKNYNPGYYKSTDIDKGGNRPSGNVEYIGTENIFTANDSWPYIWYTNDGKDWVLIAAPITSDNNMVYVLSTATSLYREYDAGGNAILRHGPAGFLLTFNADGTTNTKIGRSNFIKTGTYLDTNGWPEDGGISDANPQGNTKNIISNLTGALGVVEKVNGFPQCFRISKDYWDIKTEDGRYNLHNWIETTIPGMSQRMTWNTLSKTSDPKDLSWNTTLVYTDADGNYLLNADGSQVNLPNDKTAGAAILHTYTLNLYNNASDSISRIKHWFAWALNEYLIGSTNNQPWRDRKYAMFTEKTGWTGEWDNLLIYRESGHAYIAIGCETNIIQPTSDSGSGVIPILRCRFHVDIQIGDSSVYGNAVCFYGGFDRSTGGDPNAPAGAKWLCAYYGAFDSRPTGLGSEDAEKYSIPIINDFSANFIVTSNYGVHKVKIDYTGSNEIFEVTELNGGGGGTSGDYELPTASSTVKGGIKVGSGLKMSGDILSTDSWLDGLWVTSDIGVRANDVSITESDPTDDPSGLYIFSDREMKDLGHTVQRYYRIPVATHEQDGAMSASDKEQLDWLWEHRNDESSGGGSSGFGHEIAKISFNFSDDEDDENMNFFLQAKDVAGTSKYFNIRIPTASTVHNGLMSVQDKDDIARLKERVTALENMLTLIQESPLAVNLSLADNATTATLNLTGTDVNGNDVNFNIEHNSDSDVTIS